MFSEKEENCFRESTSCGNFLFLLSFNEHFTAAGQWLLDTRDLLNEYFTRYGNNFLSLCISIEKHEIELHDPVCKTRLHQCTRNHSKVSQMEEATLFLNSNKYLVKLNHWIRLTYRWERIQKCSLVCKAVEGVDLDGEGIWTEDWRENWASPLLRARADVKDAFAKLGW